MDTVTTAVVATLVTLALTYVSQKYLFKRPQVLVQHRLAGPSSHPQQVETVLRFTGVFEFYNSSKHTALNLTLFKPADAPDLRLRMQDVRHLDALERKSVKHEPITITVPTAQVAEAGSRWPELLLPEELRNHRFTLYYENEMGQRFKTEYVMKDGLPRSTVKLRLFGH